MSDRIETQLAIICSLIHSAFSKEPLGYEAFKVSGEAKKTDKKEIFKQRLRDVFGV